MEKIMLIKINKIKNEKLNTTALNWIKLEKIDKDTFKGMTEYTMWINDEEAIKKFKAEDFGKVIDADLTYSTPDYKGNCKLTIKKILTSNGTIEL